MTDEPLTESEAVTPTKTALVLDLADGRTVELTAHVATARDSGLRGMDEIDRENEDGPDSQRAWSAGPATLVLRDVDAEDDDPIGLLPTFDLELDVDVPDDWERLDPDTTAWKFGDPYVHNPVFEHSSGEAWLAVTRKFVDGEPGFDIYIEAGTPSLGIHRTSTSKFQDGYETPPGTVVSQMLAGYDHTVDEDGGSA